MFVHGLGGDSRKTWSSHNDPASYWPAQWLPREPGFERARIHTFGYDTKFLTGNGNCLNINHIGRLLFGELSDSLIIGSSKTRIIFVAHSMGGLIVKKALMLAKREDFHLADRVDSILFLACPHHGVGSAKLLDGVLRAVYDRQYVADLARDSMAVQNINDEFRHYAPSLLLWSFYETQNMNLWSSLVVDYSSAVLGYPGERQRAMNADHRSICKFSHPDDGSYLIIRNSLAVTMNYIRDRNATSDSPSPVDYSRALRDFLCYHAPTDDTLESLSEKRHPGTCKWILSQELFIRWSSGSPNKSPILWISGQPGWGKSVLAGFVVNQLQDAGHMVHSYFFQFGHPRKSTFEDCVRSLVYQIAMGNDNCRKALLKMQAEGLKLEGMEGRMLWRKLAASGVLRGIQGRQYCVIDGLDECGQPSAVLEMLAQILEEESTASFCLLLVGRDVPNVSSGFCRLRSEIYQHLVLQQSQTSAALTQFVSDRIQSIPAINKLQRSDVIAEVVDRSQGSFLWADLVLQELSRCHGRNEIFKTLENTPAGMETVYNRILDTIAQNEPSIQLARAILTWTICAARPLTVRELERALEIEFETTFPNFSESITTLCGQLIAVDQVGRIRLQHETAKTYLLNQESHPELLLTEGEAHTTASKVCFKSFEGNDFRRSFKSGTTDINGFTAYAVLEFPQHLSKSTTGLDDLVQTADRFLKAHLLSWLEFVLRHQGLESLYLASERLKAFGTRSRPTRSSVSLALKYLMQLAVDLTRMTYKFGDVLKDNPGAIHTVVPEFCPAKSTIYRARKRNQNLRVVRHVDQPWDDTLSAMTLSGRARVMVSRGQHLAVGARPGIVVIFDIQTYQEVRTIDHGEEVNHVALKDDERLLASSGDSFTKVWDLTQERCVHEFRHLENAPLGLEFDGNRLLAPRRHDVSFAWNLESPVTEEPGRDPSRLPEGGRMMFFDICTPTRLVALSNASFGVTVMDLDTGEELGSCGETFDNADTRPHVLDISFNPQSGLLAIGRSDMLLVVEPRFDEVVQQRAANCDMLVASSDGRMLASLDTQTNPVQVNLYDFDSLSLIYTIRTSVDDIELLRFSKDDMHLVGVYGRFATQCAVWGLEHARTRVLGLEDGGSIASDNVEDFQTPDPSAIDIILAPPGEDVVVCSKRNGTITLYAAATGAFQSVLFHSSSRIEKLFWWPKHRAVLCIGEGNIVSLHALPGTKPDARDSQGECLFRIELDTKGWVHDVTATHQEDKMIVSTLENCYLYSTTGTLLGTGAFDRLWLGQQFTVLSHVHGKALCLGFQKGIQAYDINNWTGIPEDTEVTGLVDGPWRGGLGINPLWRHKLHVSADGRTLVGFGNVRHKVKGPRELVVKVDLASAFPAGASYISPCSSPGGDHSPRTPASYSTLYNVPARQILHILDEGVVLFVDTSMWLSSLNLNAAEPISSSSVANGSAPVASLSYNRHFFIPAEALSGEDVELSCAMVGRDLVLAMHGQPVLVKGFLETVQEVHFDSYVTHEDLARYFWDALGT